MVTKWLLRGALFAAAAGFAGCGPPGTVKEEHIEVKGQAASTQAQKLLENYAKGQPLGSEVTTFAALVEDVRKEDSHRAKILEQGFKELQQPKIDTRAKAKEILAKLAPQQRPPG